MTSKHFLSACVIVKNEARYLAEWIVYHQIVGVEHFYIYDNNSEDGLASKLAPFSDIITLISWPMVDEPQRAAYRHFFDTFGQQCCWAAVIDADEFIVYKGMGDLRSFLHDHGHENGIMMQWVIFGTSGHSVSPAGLVIESYTKCHSRSPNPNIKTICHPTAVLPGEINSPHRFAYRDGRSGVPASLSTIAVFHYVTRSREDLAAKIARGDAWSIERTRENTENVAAAIQRKLDEYDGTDTTDLTMLSVAPMVRERMEQLDAASLVQCHA